MDLREFSPSATHLECARRLAIQGLITYQPYVFADDLETGVGFEFEENYYAGLIYHPDIDPELLKSPELRRLIVDPAHRDRFRAANGRLRRLYDHFVDSVLTHVGEPSDLTFLDVGCNTGYFPMSFARRKAKLAAGCDRQDFSAVFDLLNEIMGTDARFIHAHYDPMTHRIDGVEPFDVVTSFAVLCHTSDPLFHLSCLGSLARKALLVWTIVNTDDAYTVHFGEPRGDYSGDGFPICFDNLVCPSDKLMVRSMNLMGFKRVVRVPELDVPALQYEWKGYPFRGYLGLRD
ncbi:MAG TPA: DUF1698 domain-containing protein [Azospirillum sp.]